MITKNSMLTTKFTLRYIDNNIKINEVEPLSISTRSEAICRLTSTKSQRTVAADTTHTQNAKPAARRTKGRERRRRDVRRPQGSPSSLEADSSRPPREPPPPTNASSSRLFLIFLPTRSGTAACTALSITYHNATANASVHCFTTRSLSVLRVSTTFEVMTRVRGTATTCRMTVNDTQHMKLRFVST